MFSSFLLWLSWAAALTRTHSHRDIYTYTQLKDKSSRKLISQPWTVQKQKGDSNASLFSKIQHPHNLLRCTQVPLQGHSSAEKQDHSFSFLRLPWHKFSSQNESSHRIVTPWVHLSMQGRLFPHAVRSVFMTLWRHCLNNSWWWFHSSPTKTLHQLSITVHEAPGISWQEN